MARIALIGAAGYVGMELVRQLKQAGHEVIGIARSNGKFLLEPFGIRVEHPSRAGDVGEVDIVVNLAYPNSGSIHRYRQLNRELLLLVRQLAGKNAKIIHTSTLAVFGYALEMPPAPVPVRPRRDYLYIETKVDFENALVKTFARRDLDIVRLGNVWGPGSPGWTASMCDRILFGRYVGFKGVDGYSNITDVANAASYLSFLIGNRRDAGLHFHHLAELGHLRWSFWIERISKSLRFEPVYSEIAPGYPRSMLREAIDAFSDFSPVKVYRKLVWGRYTGSLARSAVHLIPFKSFESMQKRQRGSGGMPGPGLSPDDATFLNVVGAKTQFTNHLVSGWKPPVDAEKSWKAVRTWMDEAGYLD